jgi:hypothetical protein
MLTRSALHLAFGKDDVSCLDMPTRHTRTSRGTEALATSLPWPRWKRLPRSAEAACLAARAKPANPRSRRRNWIFLTRTHGQVSSVGGGLIKQKRFPIRHCLFFISHYPPVPAFPTLIAFSKNCKCKHGAGRPLSRRKICEPQIQFVSVDCVRVVSLRPVVRRPNDHCFVRQDDP